MRTFTPLDDKQLWRLADASDGQDRSWPLFVTPVRVGDGEALLVELALPAEHVEQWKWVASRLNKVAFDHSHRAWLIRKKSFDSLGTVFPCKGCTPSFYRKWGISPDGKNGDSGEQSVDNRSASQKDDSFCDFALEADDFVRYCCNLAGETNLPMARLFFNMFCQRATEWMLEHHKPLRLGFVTLYAVPYRANWKAMLHAQWPEILGVFRRKRCRKDALDAIGFTESLANADLIEMQTPETFGWTIEAVPEKRLLRAIERAEKRILEESTPDAYVRRWASLVGRKLNAQILEVFGAWLEKASKPVGYVDTAMPKNRWRLVPKVSRGRVRPSAPRPPPTRITTEPHSPDEPQSQDEPAGAEIPPVPEVPDVQSEGPDVRDSGSVGGGI